MVEAKLSPSDRDLASMAQARALAQRAKAAASLLAEFTQERIDAVVGAVAQAAAQQAVVFAHLAVEETGYGIVADKIQKNLFSAERVYEFIRPMKTVGVELKVPDRPPFPKPAAKSVEVTLTPFFEEVYTDPSETRAVHGGDVGPIAGDFGTLAQRFDFTRYKTVCDVGGPRADSV